MTCYLTFSLLATVANSCHPPKSASHLRVSLGFFGVGALLACISIVRRGYFRCHLKRRCMMCMQIDWILVHDGDASVEVFVLLLVCWVLIGCLNGVAMGCFAGLVTHLPFRPYQVMANIAS